MKTPSVLLLAGTLLVAGSAALLARVLLTPPPPPPAHVVESKPVEQPKPSHPSILVASRDLQPGDFIDPSALRWQASDTAHDDRLYFVEGDEESRHLTGASVRQPIAAGAPLTSNLVVKANEPGFIATVIKPGMRAIAVPTSNSASLYSMISLGDRVDVLVNLQRDQEQTQDATLQTPRLAAQTLLQDVRVLSINNRMRSPLQPRPEADAKNNKNPDAYPDSYPEVVTLEVPPVYAERLALANQIGTLQLLLRSSLEPSTGQATPGTQRVTTLAQTTRIYEASAPAVSEVNTFRGDAATAVQFGSR
ncbi:pilus assembly protein CpaB [Pseudomonas flavescens]|uniref:Pilus assembly protein CpaB n=1 Tax=Phytopseudomonas flavescens TaxID=29435 RepID=A0A1G8NZ74_9GAMM|nr:Flp pilus assembly protein CpaB [Pseudomonas flavescens]SDI85544.1 pilus assembly protein CpaB [Pseudomonas flavescens]